MTIRHSPEIQGMRGACVTAVMLFHFIVPFRDELLDASAAHRSIYHIANSGWIGVDFFFAISGFVVTMLLTGGHCDGYSAFITRRIRRLLPAYLSMMAVVTLLTMTMSDMIGIRNGYAEALVWAWLLLGNVASSINGGLLDGGSLTVVHVWSLCVEFQFYALWPLLIWSTSGRIRIGCVVLVAALATIFRIYAEWDGVYYNAIYSLVFFRMDSFAYGGLAALCGGYAWSRKWSFPASAALLSPAVGYLVASSAWHKADPFVQIAGYGLLGAGAALLVLAVYVGAVPKLVAEILSSRLMVSIGDRSYSLYLWHLPFQPLVNRLLTDAMPDAGRTLMVASSLVINVAASAVLSEISYRVIERPVWSSATSQSPKAGTPAFN